MARWYGQNIRTTRPTPPAQAVGGSSLDRVDLAEFPGDEVDDGVIISWPWIDSRAHCAWPPGQASAFPSTIRSNGPSNALKCHDVTNNVYVFCDTPRKQGVCNQIPPYCCNGLGSWLLLPRHLGVSPAVLVLSDLGHCDRPSHDGLRAVDTGSLCASSGGWAGSIPVGAEDSALAEVWRAGGRLFSRRCRIGRHRARHRLPVSRCLARSWPEVVFTTTDPGVRPSRTPRPWGSR